jgi:molybdopterin molybdotransferase
MRSVPEFRAVERLVRRTRRLAIQSAWKLYTTGSVGSQTLLGLPAVHRLLGALGDRARLWPFEPVAGHRRP